MLEFTKTIKVPINLYNEQVNKNIKKYVNTDKENYGLFDNSLESDYIYMKYFIYKK